LKIRLGSRGSKLALAQTNYVLASLKEAYPEHDYEVVVIKTAGDRIQNKPLDQIGTKGLFVREIEEKIIQGDIDLGVHSMKDMPVELPKDLIFVRAWKREDPRDVLILKKAKSFSELPDRATLATGSRRRIFQLKQVRPDLNFVGIRGNIDTRLKKMEAEAIDGLVLAAAGLHRLGLREIITQYLEPEIVIPAPAQGALALEIHRENKILFKMLNALGDQIEEQKILAERTFLKQIEGGCHIPAGAICTEEQGVFKLKAFLGEEDTGKIRRVELEGKEPQKLGEKAAILLSEMG